ncbi:MAG TPA: glycosyltransferase [Bdellovibrionota bacterium]|nr:glycosyltransferase [Bdellovibrionota bacterium]
MATVPYFVLSPNTILSALGLVHGPDRRIPTPRGNWRQAVVDVIIPAHNEEHNIALSLTSIQSQTFRPRKIILVDDASQDRTVEIATKFCEVTGMEITVIRRKASIGKTPTLKRQSREFDSDVQFVLDADTVLESPNYIARAVEELYKGVGIASVCGTLLPLRHRDRLSMARLGRLRKFLDRVPNTPITVEYGWLTRIQKLATNLYRDVLYLFLQKFVYRGQMVFFGTISNPVGCAVAYRRKYVKELFDKYEPLFGDNLTNSEDIFIGFALAHAGYRNIQLTDVVARSEEPKFSELPRQIYMWTSSFLQSCFYFDPLVRSPLRAFKRYRYERKVKKNKEIQEKRKIIEQYRTPFGEERTHEYGRAMGWLLLTSAMEKVFFPVILFLMIALRLWKPLMWTFVFESAVAITILTIVAKGRRMEYLLKGVVVTPIRYTSLLYDLVTLTRFSADLWIFRNRKWRK